MKNVAGHGEGRKRAAVAKETTRISRIKPEGNMGRAHLTKTKEEVTA